ncbi:putative L-lysine 2,3-aminomutase [Treponema phagedenis]|nr:putative L-lysine 2,3-aminomutase [Treponema phagedenis]
MSMKDGAVANTWRTESAAESIKLRLPEAVSPAFIRLIEEAEEADAKALRRQVFAAETEKISLPYESADPLGESRYCVTPFLVHQYTNRVLMLTSGRCLSYCRYCFRRGFTARRQGWIPDTEIEKITDYLKQNPDIKEILVSGGDPMSGTLGQLEALLKRLRQTSPELLIRLCTRAPIFAPELFTEELLQLLKSMKPLWIIPHINHPAELGFEQKKAIDSCINAGLPMQSQSVLLRGVNNSVETLCALFHTLVCMGVKPGYLFQMDLAPGTAEFRVPLSQALGLWRELRKKLSGLSLPQFAVDLPGGGGKFPLSILALYDTIVKKDDADSFSALGLDGKVYTYPV